MLVRGLCSHVIQCVHKKNKANYFLAQRHRTATKRSNFCHSDLRDNCESAYDCFPSHLRNAHTWQNVSDNLHFGDKQNSQTV